MSLKIRISEYAGSFGEDKDAARTVRQEMIVPAIERGEAVTLDFSGMTGATQSFVHALIAEPIMRFREQAFESLFYTGVNDQIAEIISIVYRYIQESFDDMENS